VLSSGLIRAKTSVAADRNATSFAIRSFGERATDLLSTMLENMRNPEDPGFVASVSRDKISRTLMPLLRNELASKSANFLAEINDSLFREITSESGKGRSRASRVRVTVFYSETPPETRSRKEPAKNRRNLRRDI
jgi:hypothetical protein